MSNILKVPEYHPEQKLQKIYINAFKSVSGWFLAWHYPLIRLIMEGKIHFANVIIWFRQTYWMGRGMYMWFSVQTALLMCLLLSKL